MSNFYKYVTIATLACGHEVVVLSDVTPQVSEGYCTTCRRSVSVASSRPATPDETARAKTDLENWTP
ncbi:MAG TPA: hypothetical protein VJ793_23340 [Anaerolineae bacterium]|nr:hypothetical protein [Anaerolineae bacterium]